jgi:hypothetical protein
MSLRKDGTVEYELTGKDLYDKLHNKIEEMRSELRHMERALGVLDAQVRANAPVYAMRPQFSTLYWWYVSAMESYIAMSWGAFGKDKTREVILDFANRFRHWA